MGDSVASSKSKKSKGGKTAPSSGIFSFEDGSTYKGEFIVDNGIKMREGQGTYTSSSGESYTGGWIRDLQEGEGVYRFSSGSVYEGSFFKGGFHGTGKYTFPDGACYEGEWNMSKMHGKGSYKDAMQVVYTGNFYNGLYDNGVSYVVVRDKK